MKLRPEWDPEVSEICRIAGWGIEQYGSLDLANELRGQFGLTALK